jgi:hypothetical protein
VDFGTEPGRTLEVGMNVVRGLFRAWIFVTVLWFICLGAAIYATKISQWKWQYVHEIRKGIESSKVDWTRPYYEIARSPSAEKLAVNFHELGREYIEQWDKYAKEGTMTVRPFPDGSLLYLEGYFTAEDRTYLERAFWDQRWRRYAEIAKTWAAVLIGPPIALFILGWGLLWVGRGFKAASP